MKAALLVQRAHQEHGRPEATDAVIVWEIRVSAPESSADGRDLSPAERERVDRFRFDDDRRRFLVVRTALRRILAHRLSLRPAEVPLITGRGGKPELDLPPQAAALTFNVSHTDDVALIAVTGGRDVGIDVERLREGPLEEGLADRFFASGEIHRLRALPPELRREAFFACWTRKEAYLKARATGLRLPMEAFEVTVDPREPAALLRADAGGEPTSRWRLLDLDVGADHRAALAVDGAGWKLVRRRYPDGL